MIIVRTFIIFNIRKWSFGIGYMKKTFILALLYLKDKRLGVAALFEEQGFSQVA